MLRHGFGLAPLVMGLILGKLVEESFSQSMIMYDNNFFGLFESPIVSVLFALTFISLGWPMIGPILKLVSSSRRSRDEDK
jgi:putative tricarboxylic transport membrane protein